MIMKMTVTTSTTITIIIIFQIWIRSPRAMRLNYRRVKYLYIEFLFITQHQMAVSGYIHVASIFAVVEQSADSKVCPSAILSVCHVQNPPIRLYYLRNAFRLNVFASAVLYFCTHLPTQLVSLWPVPATHWEPIVSHLLHGMKRKSIRAGGTLRSVILICHPPSSAAADLFLYTVNSLPIETCITFWIV
jgi:hypothetical protein